MSLDQNVVFAVDRYVENLSFEAGFSFSVMIHWRYLTGRRRAWDLVLRNVVTHVVTIIRHLP
jgi:hypothetical protein